MRVNLRLGDCVARMAEMPEGSVGGTADSTLSTARRAVHTVRHGVVCNHADRADLTVSSGSDRKSISHTSTSGIPR